LISNESVEIKEKVRMTSLSESKNMQVDLENVDMNDLADALDTA
jgi:hypothetical protein